MFKNVYQGGPYFEIFTPQGKDSTSQWKLSGNVKKIYDKDVKGNICCLEGSPATTKMQIPKDQRQSLPLIQRYLLFQIFVPRGQEFSFELGVTDLQNNKRRILLSTSQKETHVTPLHAKVPLTILRRHVWLNLCLDMVSMVGDLWRGQTFKATESLSISANCKLRRVFTMKSQPPDTAGDEEMYGCPSSNEGELDQIPKQCQFATDVSFITQLINITKIKHAERLRGGGDTNRPTSNMDIDLNASGRRTSLNDSNYHIAFGTKVPGVPTQSKGKIVRRRTFSWANSLVDSSVWGQGNVTNRSMRSTASRNEEGDSTYRDLSASISSRDGLHAVGDQVGGVMRPEGVGLYAVGDHIGGSTRSEGVGHHSSHHRQLSDPSSAMDIEMSSRIEYDKPDVHIVQPHPPREPSSDRLRRRIRVKNGSTGGVASKDRGSSAGSLKDEGIGSVSQPNSAKSSRSGGQNSVSMSSKDSRKNRTVSDGELLVKNNSVVSKVDSVATEVTDSGVVSLGSGNQLGLSDSQGYRREYNREDYQGDGAVFDESMSDVLDVLRHGINLHEDVSSEDEREEYEESEEEPEKDSGMYLFASKPKKAPRRHISPNFLENEDSEQQQTRSPNTSRGSKSQRGARLENDFLSSDSSSQEEEDIRRKKLPGSRPQSGTSSRPHSGNSSRPHSGTTSRPHSGSTSRPHSGTTSKPHSASSREATSPKGHRHSAIVKPHRKDKLNDSSGNFNHVPKFTNASPELRISTQLPTHRSEVTVNGGATNRSVSRMNRKSLREIPQDDVRLSVMKSSEKPYNPRMYQMAEITESFEAQMFASMKRSAEDAMEDVSIKSPHRVNPPALTPRKTPHTTPGAEAATTHRHIYDFSPTLTSDDDTSLSTWKAPPDQNNCEGDLKPGRMSTDTLTSSNPRDWSGVFSPPIVFPGERADSTEDLSISSSSPRKDTSSSGSTSPRKVYAPQDPNTDEEELDLLYDSCLNCYYDPKTCKYYELVV